MEHPGTSCIRDRWLDKWADMPPVRFSDDYSTCEYKSTNYTTAPSVDCREAFFKGLLPTEDPIFSCAKKLKELPSGVWNSAAGFYFWNDICVTSIVRCWIWVCTRTSLRDRFVDIHCTDITTAHTCWQKVLYYSRGKVFRYSNTTSHPIGVGNILNSRCQSTLLWIKLRLKPHTCTLPALL